MWTVLLIRSFSVKKITLFGILLAAALVLNLAESMIPVFHVLPGGKLGLANVVTMLVMLWYGPFEAIVFGILRSLLGGVLCGMPTMLLYGGAGTVLSVAMMWISAKLGKRMLSMCGVSMLGAFAYNVGQLAVAAAVIRNVQIFRYLPVLTLIATVCGCLTGLLAESLSRKKLWK